MVSSLLVDTVNDPTQELNVLYDNSDAFPAKVSAHFSKIFETVDAFREIPTLDVRNPPQSYSSRALVRFRAMVQDTSPSPQMYLSKLKGDKCGGWGITSETTTDADYSYSDLRECTVVWAVNVPGENMWYSKEVDGIVQTEDSEKPYEHQLPHKFPVPGAPHVGVQLKIYDNATQDALKSTDVLTFVGILTSEPVYSELDCDTPLEVPTLHVLFSRPLESALFPAIYSARAAVAETREELISWIADEALGGDRDAAEWVLLISIARVQSRSPAILPPSLTLAHFPSPSQSASVPSLPLPTIVHILSLILPFSLALPLSLHLLNSSSFTPESKDEDLHAGYLQLPAGCTIFITESGVVEGKVVEKGVMNLKALQDVIDTQSLPYVFPFSQFSFPTDLGFIILAEGRKSAFFQTNITIPLQQSSGKCSRDLYKTADKIHLPSIDKLGRFRQLVNGAKLGKVQVGEAASEHIQNDFVQERQDDKSVTADDLITRMTIVRLIALSFHEKEVNVDIWERAKALDGRRKARAM